MDSSRYNTVAVVCSSAVMPGLPPGMESLPLHLTPLPALPLLFIFIAPTASAIAVYHINKGSSI